MSQWETFVHSSVCPSVGIVMQDECDLRPSLIKCAPCPSFKRIDNDTTDAGRQPSPATVAGGPTVQQRQIAWDNRRIFENYMLIKNQFFYFIL